MRVPAVFLALWLALLAGAAPAVACAAAGGGDCCPDRGPVPCPEVESGILGTTTACCVSVPAPAQATSYSATRVDSQKPMQFGPSDITLIPALPVALALPDARPSKLLLTTAWPHRDDTLTYLRTRRLRL